MGTFESQTHSGVYLVDLLLTSACIGSVELRFPTVADVTASAWPTLLAACGSSCEGPAQPHSAVRASSCREGSGARAAEMPAFPEQENRAVEGVMRVGVSNCLYNSRGKDREGN